MTVISFRRFQFDTAAFSGRKMGNTYLFQESVNACFTAVEDILRQRIFPASAACHALYMILAGGRHAIMMPGLEAAALHASRRENAADGARKRSRRFRC